MRRSLVLAGAAVGSLLAAAPLQAQGSAVDQQGACMAGRASTGIAHPCDDGSAVFFSPAAIAELPGAMSAGAAIVRSGNVFRYDPAYAPGGQPDHVRRPTATIAVPQAYLAYRLDPRLAAGIAVLAPYGLGLEWPVCPVEDPRCEGPNFEGRFTGYDNSLRGVYVQPTVAYQVVPGLLSLGAGVDFVRGSIEVNRRQFGPAAVGLGTTEIADARLAGSGTGVTYHLAGLLQLDTRTTLGIRYLGAARIDMEGDATFRQVGTGNPGVDALIAAQFPQNQAIATTLEFPAQMVVGLATRATDRLALMADFQRTYWSSFDSLAVDFAALPDEVLALNYRDANAIRFGAEFAATEAVTLRAGWRYNEAATPRATPLLPEGERNVLGLGVGSRFTPALTADLSFQNIRQPDRAGPVLPGGPRAGIYESTGNVFNFTIGYRFGAGGR
jgi:long-chain fatty acid transport protein